MKGESRAGGLAHSSLCPPWTAAVAPLIELGGANSRKAPLDEDRGHEAFDEDETLPGRSWQFSRTKMCKFEIIGMCAKGTQCPFAHTATDLRLLPDLSCTKLCKSLIQNGKCENTNCSYAHSKEELRGTSTFHKTKMCRFSQLGHCALGGKCNFAHSPHELRLSQSSQREQEVTLCSLGQSIRDGLPAGPLSPQYVPAPSPSTSGLGGSTSSQSLAPPNLAVALPPAAKASNSSRRRGRRASAKAVEGKSLLPGASRSILSSGGFGAESISKVSTAAGELGTDGFGGCLEGLNFHLAELASLGWDPRRLPSTVLPANGGFLQAGTAFPTGGCLPPPGHPIGPSYLGHFSPLPLAGQLLPPYAPDALDCDARYNVGLPAQAQVPLGIWSEEVLAGAYLQAQAQAQAACVPRMQPTYNSPAAAVGSILATPSASFASNSASSLAGGGYPHFEAGAGVTKADLERTLIEAIENASKARSNAGPGVFVSEPGRKSSATTDSSFPSRHPCLLATDVADSGLGSKRSASKAAAAQSKPPEDADVWQVKNTFLAFSPENSSQRPIRSVRTADGALCSLGSLGEDSGDSDL